MHEFEDNIKQKLERRHIQPSATAWSNLSQRINKHEQTKPKSKSWFWGVAACLIGVLLLVGGLFTTRNTSPAIVVTPTHLKQDHKIVKVPAEANNKAQTQELITNKKSKETSVKQVVLANTNTPKKAGKTSDAKKSKPNVKAITQQDNLSFEDRKVQEVVAKVAHLKKENKQVTDAEIEALLIEAQNDLRQHNIQAQVAGNISAEQLLKDVEAELNQSFRDRVFEAIREKLGTVKTAIADRND